VTPSPLGLYVHFPWCRRRCPYCDFAIAVAPLGEIPHSRYADAVLAELAARAPRFVPGRTLVSIYFGGGTPALWEARAIARVITAAKQHFAAAPAVEITVEANPNDCIPETLAALAAAGVNRLSIGAQTFTDSALVQLGRDHDAAQALAAIPAARAAGIENVSLDLIFALPGLGDAAWQRTLAQALALAPDHISAYQLTVEPRTSLGAKVRKGHVVPASDDACATQFEHTDTTLTAAGYEHYEVSSYAQPGRRAIHNALYWRQADTLGLGNGAHSFWRDGQGGGWRFGNHRSVKTYLAGAAAKDGPHEADQLIAELVRLDSKALAKDAIWLGLRTKDGVLRAALPDSPLLAEAARAGLVTIDGERVRPTLKGLLFGDELGHRLAATL
jgi:oxygen-independent coproporphyrinogen-3 oxidase